jgi:hypothetical protein
MIVGNKADGSDNDDAATLRRCDEGEGEGEPEGDYLGPTSSQGVRTPTPEESERDQQRQVAIAGFASVIAGRIA